MAKAISSSQLLDATRDEGELEVHSFDHDDSRFVAVTADSLHTVTFTGDPADLINVFERMILAAKEVTKDVEPV